MANDTAKLSGAVALVTGGARRIGATIVETLHAAGMHVVIHYRSSQREAEALADRLNARRRNSAITLRANLHHTTALAPMVREAAGHWGRLDLLVNNASSFYPTPLGEITEAHWDDLLGSNLKAPLFLAQAAMPHLRERKGAIVNLIDIHGFKPLAGHSVYCAAKAGLVMLTRSLARELAPEVRVNGIAPGAILWPEGVQADPQAEAQLREAVPLARMGEPADIGRTVLFFAQSAPYITGQILAVDGGRSIT